jgi:hypothetical protein
LPLSGGCRAAGLTCVGAIAGEPEGWGNVFQVRGRHWSADRSRLEWLADLVVIRIGLAVTEAELERIVHETMRNFPIFDSKQGARSLRAQRAATTRLARGSGRRRESDPVLLQPWHGTA